jgi:hypothetical protein
MNVTSATTTEPVAGVFHGHEDHETKEQEHAGRLHDFEDAEVQSLAANPLQGGHDDMSAVEHGEGQQVHDGEVHIQHDAEPHDELPAVAVFKKGVIDPEDANRSAEMARAHLGLR